MRYTLYMSGCPLRCLYCHNPDTWEMRLGERVTVGQVVADIEEYLVFLRDHPRRADHQRRRAPAAAALPAGALPAGEALWDLHTVLDTSGNLGDRASDELLDLTDLVLLDVKSGLPDTYRAVTGAELRADARVRPPAGRAWQPDVDPVRPGAGVHRRPDNLAAVAAYVASLGEPVERVEVLPYHSLGGHKYAELGLPYPLDGVPEPTCGAGADGPGRLYRGGPSRPVTLPGVPANPPGG